MPKLPTLPGSPDHPRPSELHSRRRPADPAHPGASDSARVQGSAVPGNAGCLGGVGAQRAGNQATGQGADCAGAVARNKKNEVKS